MVSICSFLIRFFSNVTVNNFKSFEYNIIFSYLEVKDLKITLT